MPRKLFWVKPQFQFKNLLIAVALTIVVSMIVYLSLSYALIHAARELQIPEQVVNSLLNAAQSILLTVTVVLILVFGSENFFRFHRIAGPLHSVERMIHSFASGDFSADFHVRRRDELKELVQELQAMKQGISSLIFEDRKTCARISQRLDRLSHLISQKVPPQDIQKEIDEIQSDLARISSGYKI